MIRAGQRQDKEAKSSENVCKQDTDRACAAEDRVRLLRDDPQVGHGELGARAEGASEGQRQLLIEEDSLAGHEREGARQVVLVEVRRGAGSGGAEPSRGADERLLEVAKPWMQRT